MPEENSSVFRDRNAITLLDRILEGKIEEIMPTMDPIYGFRYPSAEKITELPPNETANLLNRLASANILTKTFYSRIVSCPLCNSFNIMFTLRCPNCNSVRIIKHRVIEHFYCGHLDLEEEYKTEKGLICPHCHKELSQLTSPGTDYAIRGVTYTCEECKKNLDSPLQFCTCRACGKDFIVTDANLQDIYAFSLNKSRIDEIKRNIIDITPLEKLLKDTGLNVEIPGFVTGTSGVTHRFDLVARSPRVTEKVVLIDIDVNPSEAKHRAVVSLYAKLMDVRNALAVFITVPKLGEKTRSLAASYGIHCIEGDSLKEAFEKLRLEKHILENFIAKSHS